MKECNFFIKKRKNLFQNIFLSIISLLVFFLAGETIIRTTLGAPLITQPDRILFWKYKKDQVGHQKLYSPISRVDENGFRYSGKVFDPDLPLIYVGGDSYAWGEGVLDTETFSARLQDLLDSHGLEYNVLNGGVPAYGIEQIINRMEIECKKHNPNYVIFLWVEADINRLRGLSPEQKKRFLRDYKLRSIFRYSAFLKIIKELVYDKLLRKDLSLGCWKDRNKEYAKTHSFNEKMEDLTPMIKENIYYLKNRKIIPIWAYMTVPSEEFKDYLDSLSRELLVVLINPESEYRKNFHGLNNMETESSEHFKPEVYELLAEKIFKEIFRREASFNF